MNQNQQGRLCIFLILLFFFVCIEFNANAQNSSDNLISKGDNSPRIEWVSCWPSEGNEHQAKRFKDQINALFFGIKTPRLSTPISILAANLNDFWVLDQGNKLLFEVKEGVGDIPHSVHKSDFDFSSLVGICAGSNSSILFTDSKAQKVFKYLPDEKKLLVLNNTIVLEQPTGIAYLSKRKEIWVVETKAHRISVLNEKGELVKTIGKRGNAPGEFNYPTHISIDNKGNIYITDAMNFRIQVLNSDGEVISVFGQAGDSTGHFASPKGVATDSFRNIYVVDALFHVVQVFDIDGKFLYKFGNQGHGNGEFWMPSGIFIDTQDNIYVADTYNSRIQIFKLIHSNSK
jgi:DNA-binding beta-propeller fold protein YncE